MRVLVVHNRYRSDWPSGEDVVVEAEVDLLKQRGHEVARFDRTNDQIDSPLSKIGAAISVIHSRPAAREFAQTIASFSPDVVHVHNLAPLISTAVLDVAHRHRVAVVATLHNYRRICVGGTLSRDGMFCDDCVGSSALHGVRHGCYRSSRLASIPVTVSRMVDNNRGRWQHVQRLICPSDDVRTRYQQAGFAPERLVVKPHFVPRFPDPVAHDPHGPALFVGRLDAAKGIEHLLDAWIELPDCSLIVVGDGPLGNQVRSHPVAQRDNVQLTGLVSPTRVQELLGQCSVVIVPSIAIETFSLAVRDAMALGRPVIAPDRGAPAALVGHERCGLLYRAGDSAALVAAVRRLRSSDELAAALAAAARTSAREHFDPDRNYDQLMAIYHAARMDVT